MIPIRSSEYVLTGDTTSVYIQPKYVMTLNIANSLHCHLEKQDTPCWFYRKMCTLLLGFKWEKYNE